MRRRIGLGMLLMTFALGSSAEAALIVNASGLLTGATGVDVGGTLYDVEFVEGTCITVFGGCDSASDFMFTTTAEGNAAAEALLALVFIDGPAGNFDTQPNVTVGCSDPNACLVQFPLELTSSSVVFVKQFQNGLQVGGLGNFPDSSGGFGNLDVNLDTSTRGSVWARFTPAEASVPEPASLSLLGLGLAGMGVRRWRRRTA